ncbi:MAG TPA: hypothetical protein VL625_04950, partial [Patescibacteria group bacterium]|nr:hypothetical protein [Patescibacteria group bacterium]
MDFKAKADKWDVTDASENWQGGRSRRMGAMVQLAVFLSGLFFTLITSAALNISVSAMLAEDNRRLLADTQQTISDNLIDLEQSIRTVSAIIYLSESTNDADWKKRVIYAVPHLKKFDHVLLVQKDATGRWQRREILTSENAPQDNIPLLMPGAEDDLANRVVAPNVLNLDYTAFVGDLPESPTAEYPPRISITERPFIFAHVMNPANPGAGLVIGVSRVTNIAGPEWLANRPVIERILVTDATSTNVIFDMNRNSGAQHQRMMVPDDKSFEFRLGNDKLQLYADPGLDTKAYFLEQIPLLMLLAGLLLTGSATMFVRNKQKHEQRLTAVNTILARKNEELGEEVSERARLNN